MAPPWKQTQDFPLKAALFSGGHIFILSLYSQGRIYRTVLWGLEGCNVPSFCVGNIWKIQLPSGFYNCGPDYNVYSILGRVVYLGILGNLQCADVELVDRNLTDADRDAQYLKGVKRQVPCCGPEFNKQSESVT